jgi:hypothetical protein
VNQTLCVAYGASENLPTSADIDVASDQQLRKIAKDLLAVAQEYRMSAAHFKLQHNLLSLTSSEAVKRAEVEHQLARREVEILQSEEYRSRQSLAIGLSPEPAELPELESARTRIKEMEQLNATLERRLRRAKRLIEDDNDKYELLLEENSRLKKRIRDNREHFTLMLDHGSLSSSPRAEFASPHYKYPRNRVEVGGQDPFAALLAADQVLSREPGSVPPTPPRHQVTKHHHYGHTRGTHSMSSLPVTPSHRRSDGIAQKVFLTPTDRTYKSPRNPGLSAERDRHERDSTISASDVEEALTDEDVPASQASSLATSMLRRHPGSSMQEDSSFSASPGKSSTLLQSKLFGQVKKAGVERSRGSDLKRKPSIDASASIHAKKAKLDKSFGIGIES